MRREAKVLLDKSIDSLFLAIDHFNRPYDRGRHEAVLMLLDRGFELLLKAVIVHRGGSIREKGEPHTIGFDKCVCKCISDKATKCLDEHEAFTIRTINALRDAAQHYVVTLSEQHLYMYTQAGFTLFAKLLTKYFKSDIGDYFPQRVLPITSNPPQDFRNMIDAEFADIRKLLAPNSRKRLQARAKIRHLAILEDSLAGEPYQPSEKRLARYIDEIKTGKDWTYIFPGVAVLQLDTSGTGLNVTLRITRSEGQPVRLVDEATADVDTPIVAVRKVDPLGFYTLGAKDLARKIDLTLPKTIALIRYLRLQESDEYFREFKIKSVSHKLYSRKALEKLRQEMPQVDMEEVWRKHSPMRRSSR